MSATSNEMDPDGFEASSLESVNQRLTEMQTHLSRNIAPFLTQFSAQSEGINRMIAASMPRTDWSSVLAPHSKTITALTAQSEGINRMIASSMPRTDWSSVLTQSHLNAMSGLLDAMTSTHKATELASMVPLQSTAMTLATLGQRSSSWLEGIRALETVAVAPRLATAIKAVAPVVTGHITWGTLETSAALIEALGLEENAEALIDADPGLSVIASSVRAASMFIVGTSRKVAPYGVAGLVLLGHAGFVLYLAGNPELAQGMWVLLYGLFNVRADVLKSYSATKKWIASHPA